MQGSDTADQEELDLDGVTVPRSKPFKYAYEKEIVMYAYFKKLDYFSTECIYSPNAYRGHARAYIKDLEKIRPSAILVREEDFFTFLDKTFGKLSVVVCPF